MNTEKMDRRIRKTRKQLLNGLTTLMQKKDIKDISVKELTDFVDINRGTFYLHYKDIFDMLEIVENDFFEEFNILLDHDIIDSDFPNPHTVLTNIFSYLYKHKEMTSALIGPHGDLSFLNKLKVIVQEHIHYVWDKHNLDQGALDYYSAFIISGCVGLIEVWLQNKCTKSIEEMVIISQKMILSGIEVFS